MSASDSRPRAVDEALRRRFEAAWLAGRPLAIEDCLPGPGEATREATLEELVCIEMEFAWHAWAEGQSREAAAGTAGARPPAPRVEDYLARFPQLDRPAVVLRLVQEEALVRRQCGQPITVDDYLARFPVLAEHGSLASLLGVGNTGLALGADTFLRFEPGRTRLPAQGGVRFGNYELLEELGRGGMGVVYRARQCSADRTVALKIIRRECLEALPADVQRSALERFRHEAQAAARLDHENLVTVYEVGELDGQPFYSMRCVEGRSLAQLLREGPLDGRRAARYVEAAARGVHEAHEHGILHRDLKPANILIEARADRPMVVDFGLAKLVQQDQELTQHGDVMGTPPYMSPEQALDSARVTAQSDVYALGATLYHLLTGRAPFQAATAVETLRQVTHEEPAPPRRLDPSIDRDLETICLECLQKEPPRRYASAAALADDLRRYLQSEPIQARPVSTAERVWRWCRRNRLVAALIASTAAFLLLALTAATVGYVKTSAALATARAALEQSETSYRKHREAVDHFFTHVSEGVLGDQPGMQPLRKELLADTLRFYEGFLEERAGDPTVRDELGRARFRVGCITEEIDSPEAALAHYEQARQIQEELAADEELDRLQELAGTLNALGRAAHRLHRVDDAQAAYSRAISVRQRLVELGPDRQDFRRNLANTSMNLGLLEKQRGRLAEARSRFDAAQALRREVLRHSPDDFQTQCDFSMGAYNLGSLAMAMDDEAGARRHLAEAIAGFERLLDKKPQSLANQNRLAIVYRTLADLHAARGEAGVARPLYQKALDRTARLVSANPDVPEYAGTLAGLHMNIGLLCKEQGEVNAAVDAFRQAAAVLGPLVAGRSDVPTYQRDLAATEVSLAELLMAAGDRAGARRAAASAISRLEALVLRFSGNSEYPARLTTARALLSRIGTDKAEANEGP
jgi:serine/threonine-protein kinase